MFDLNSIVTTTGKNNEILEALNPERVSFLMFKLYITQIKILLPSVVTDIHVKYCCQVFNKTLFTIWVHGL